MNRRFFLISLSLLSVYTLLSLYFKLRSISINLNMVLIVISFGLLIAYARLRHVQFQLHSKLNASSSAPEQPTTNHVYKQSRTIDTTGPLLIYSLTHQDHYVIPTFTQSPDISYDINLEGIKFIRPSNSTIIHKIRRQSKRSGTIIPKSFPFPRQIINFN